MALQKVRNAAREGYPLILTGPAGCGKTHSLQALAVEQGRTLRLCSCRRDRTLRDGRSLLHTWARCREPTLLWLDGADELTPEAQAFLRRVLETHSPSVLFVIECRDIGRLQEPIRSRCTVVYIGRPTRESIQGVLGEIKGLDAVQDHELSYRQAGHLQWLSSYGLMDHVAAPPPTPPPAELPPPPMRWIREAHHPEKIITDYIRASKDPDALIQLYGNCLSIGGSMWALAAFAFYSEQNDEK